MCTVGDSAFALTSVLHGGMAMRRFWKPACFIFFAILTSGAYSEVSTSVSLRDSNVPLVPVDVNTALKYVDYGQIMVGTQLSVVIDSNVAEHWSGRLLIEEDYNDFGVLYARGPYDEFANGYVGSILPDAGLYAGVFPASPYWDEEDKYVQGFDFYGDDPPEVNVGDWFVIDYNSVAIGDCNVALYWQQDYEPFDYGLIHHIEFEHVPTRDFNTDWQVNFQDFSVLSGYWHDTNCVDTNDCGGADLDISGAVDANDLYLFADYWLEKTK